MKKARLDRRNKERATPKKDKKHETWTGERNSQPLLPVDRALVGRETWDSICSKEQIQKITEHLKRLGQGTGTAGSYRNSGNWN